MGAQFTSRTNRVTVRSGDGGQFVRAALWRYFRQCARGVLRPHRRTPDTVKGEYDGERGRLADRAAAMTWDDLLYGDRSDNDFILADDRVTWSSFARPRACNLKRLEAVVQSLPSAQATVVEFGSGTGRNLLHLKREFPTIHCIGLELSPVSVELARALADRFELDVEFHVCDVTGCVPVEPHSAGLVFSCHALEQMPRIFPTVVARMCETSSCLVLMLEPVPELWPWNTRGVASRLRVHALDRVRGLMPVLRRLATSGEWEMVAPERLRTASNPLNETCQIVLRRRGPGLRA